jgi:hypothetical protein
MEFDDERRFLAGGCLGSKASAMDFCDGLEEAF